MSDPNNLTEKFTTLSGQLSTQHSELMAKLDANVISELESINTKLV